MSKRGRPRTNIFQFEDKAVQHLFNIESDREAAHRRVTAYRERLAALKPEPEYKLSLDVRMDSARRVAEWREANPPKPKPVYLHQVAELLDEYDEATSE